MIKEGSFLFDLLCRQSFLLQAQNGKKMLLRTDRKILTGPLRLLTSRLFIHSEKCDQTHKKERTCSLPTFEAKTERTTTLCCCRSVLKTLLDQGRLGWSHRLSPLINPQSLLHPSFHASSPCPQCQHAGLNHWTKARELEDDRNVSSRTGFGHDKMERNGRGLRQTQ